MKNTTTAPDLLTDSYPLDNNSVTDLLEHRRPRTDSSLFNQIIGRIPANSENNSPTFQPVNFIRNTNQQLWSEVNGDWRPQRNPLANDVDVGGGRGESLWFDSDQIDVPLLTSTMVI